MKGFRHRAPILLDASHLQPNISTILQIFVRINSCKYCDKNNQGRKYLLCHFYR